MNRIKALMPHLEQSIPPSVHVALMSDRSLVTQAAVHDVQITMIITIALVVLVIFIFLRTLWATIIPSLAVPLSLLATAGMMYAAGFSLDNISLMALTISVGFVVDDAIVMIENIVALYRTGRAPRCRRRCAGAGQIGFTIISITFSLIAVFIPLFFMGGIIGRLFREFADHRVGRCCASAAVSLTLTPVLCALFLKHENAHDGGRVNRLAEHFFNWLVGAYDRGLRFVFRHQLATLLTTLTLIVVTGYLYMIIPKGFFPQQDTGFIFGEVDTRQDASFQMTTGLAHQIVDIVKRDPAVQGVFSLGGAYAYNPTENTARVFIQLKPFDERDVTADQVIQRLRPQVAQVQGITVLHAGGAGHHVGGRLEPDAVSVHADRYQHRRAQPLGADHRAGDAQAAGAAGRGVRPADRRAAYRRSTIDRDAASRLGHLHADDRRHAVRRVRPARRSRRSTPRPINIRSCWRCSRNSATIPARWRRSTCPAANGAQVPLSAFAHSTSKVEPLVGQPSGPVPGGHAVVQPGARHGARPGGRRASRQLTDELRMPATLHGIVPGHRAGVPGVADHDAVAGRRRDPRGLHRAGHALRELHPPDHDPLGAAVGRRRRAADADAVAATTST